MFECPACHNPLFAQGMMEQFLCLNTKCELYGKQTVPISMVQLYNIIDHVEDYEDWQIGSRKIKEIFGPDSFGGSDY